MKLFYDLETTGFVEKAIPLSHPHQPRIVQIGAVLDDDEGNEVARLNVMLLHEDLPDPVVKSWSKAESIHGISPARTKKMGVTESIGIELLLELIACADTIVGHNLIGYDNKVLLGTARRVISNEAFDPFAGKELFDTMLAGAPVCKLSGGFRGQFKSPKLIELYRHFFKEDFEDAHQAISDILATRACFYQMKPVRIAERAEA